MTVPVPALAALMLLAACGTSTVVTEKSSTPPGTEAVATVDTSVATGAAALQPGVAEAATQATGISKMKLRLDADGQWSKQSVYHGDESRIAEPVRALAAKKFPGGTATRYETEWYADHGEVHEVEVKTTDGKTCEVAAKPDGTELYVECHETEASLPAPVKDAVSTAYPDGKILEAERKTGPNLDEYTIEVQSGDAEYYLIVAPDGTLSKTLRRIPAIVEVVVK